MTGNVITTSEIAPSPILAPFLRCYNYREFDTKGLDMEKPWHAPKEMTMVFFFKAKPIKLVDQQTNQIIKKGTYCDITGLATHYLGMATFNGPYSFFEICFRPNGFNTIFGLPLHAITDHIIAAEDILDLTFKELYEQLCEAKDLAAMGILADAYLVATLKERKSVDLKNGITWISNLIIKNPGLLNVTQLAYSANMCVRNFERHFSDQVGMSPKLFCSVVRFNHALDLKLRSPGKDWTSIAFECGYFDQMHLIKDFKRFSGNAPSVFVKQTPLSEQQYSGQMVS